MPRVGELVGIGARAVLDVAPPLAGRTPSKLSIDPKLMNSASGTFSVRLDLPNPKGDSHRGEVPAEFRAGRVPRRTGVRKRSEVG